MSEALDLLRGRPTLHSDKGDGPDTACIEQWVAMLRGATSLSLPSDHPSCSNAVVVAAAQAVNDRLGDEDRQLLWALLPRLLVCDRAAHPQVERRIERRLALWCARSVEHLCDDPRVAACNDVTERWLVGDATDDELAAARDAAWTVAAGAWAPAAAAARAAAGAAWAAGYAAKVAEDLVAWLDRLLDAHDKIRADEGALADVDPEADELAREVEAIIDGWEADHDRR